QHPPTEIPKLLAKLHEGHDVVYAMPPQLPHSWWRNLTSKITKNAFSIATGNRHIRNVNAFRAFRTSLRVAFADCQSPQVIIDVLLGWGTDKITTTPVRQDARLTGKSNYTFSKLVNYTIVLLTGYSTLPLRMASLVGFFFTLFGMLVLAYAIGRSLVGEHVPGFPFLAALISIFSGVQLFILGIFGEYLAKIFQRSFDRPPYISTEVIDNLPSVGSSGNSPAGM
ncbi:MAG: glycosyltransferase, partial [Planctomycetota bacterium]|nr:glycosyltransferase [Planctomycetota bacterium]